MKARVGILTFPGSNSEEETFRACLAAGIDAQILHWSTSLETVRRYDAYILPGGFAYEDRVRAGAIAAHDRLMEAVVDAADRGRLILGICNGAQILLEAGLVPGLATPRRVEASFAPNRQRSFLCRRVYVRLANEPSRCAITAALPPDAVLPMWAAHGEGRLAAPPTVLERLLDGRHVVFRYAHADGSFTEAPNGSALDAAALTNVAGTILAIMPHAEREEASVLASPGVSPLFAAFAAALASPGGAS